MRVKSPSRLAPRLLGGTVAQGRAVLRGTWALFVRNKLSALGVLIFGIALGWIIHFFDAAWLEHYRYEYHTIDLGYSVAWYFSTYGDYLTYNVPLAVLIWTYGTVTKSSHWRRVAVACFIGATLAGLFDDALRLTLGRPRPDMLLGGGAEHLTDRFYGPVAAMHGGYQSFPSGHAASVFGTAMALLVTQWRLGILASSFAVIVVWARLELLRHYPSDVAVGIVIGIYFGLLVGLGSKACYSK